MSSPILVPCLVQLRTEFNTVAPTRDKASDGWIGDTAHSETSSDHNPDETGRVPIVDSDKVNEVHAVDVDDDLRQADFGMEDVVQFLLKRCRSGAEKRLRYMIYNRRIWSASSGWSQKAYTGASPHTEHAHFSASYETALEASTKSWGLADLKASFAVADFTANDKAFITGEINKIVTLKTNTDGSYTSPVGNAATGQATRNGLADPASKRTTMWQAVEDIGLELRAQRARFDAIEASLRQLQGSLDLLTSDPVDGENPTVDAVRYALAHPTA